MLETILLLSFCLLVGLVSLAILAWLAATGQLLTMDGLLLVAISLLIGGMFMGVFAWSWRAGEVREVLNSLRRRPSGGEAAGNPKDSKQD